MIRLLRDGDQPALEEFLRAHADSSMFLLANSRKAGLVDRGLPFQATYAAAFEGARIAGVAAHSWLGSLLVQAPRELPGVVRAAVEGSRRKATAVLGPFAQALAACEALGARAVDHEGRELLFALDLRDLVVPEPLASGKLVCRRPRDEELPLLTDWRAGYVLEARVEAPGPDLRARCAVSIELLHADGSDFVLEHGGALVSYACFNARIAEAVQIGGVWTPPALRSRGYARAVVAGSLLAARAQAVPRAILFTPESNSPAQRAYRSLGFIEVGDYGLIRL